MMVPSFFQVYGKAMPVTEGTTDFLEWLKIRTNFRHQQASWQKMEKWNYN
jgi:hypothetical protein